MARKRKELYPSDIYFAESGKKLGKQRIYHEYLDYRLGLPIATEHILNEGIRIFKESTPERPDKLDAQWKLFGSLLLAAYEFPMCDEDSVIDKLHKSGITVPQLCYDFGLQKPTNKLKLVSCAPIYVDYFKELFDQMERQTFPIDEISSSKLSPEKVFYQLMSSIKRPQLDLEIDDQDNMDEELLDFTLSELQRRDSVLEKMDEDLIPIFLWTSQKLGYSGAESMATAENIFFNSQKEDLTTTGKSPMVLKSSKKTPFN